MSNLKQLVTYISSVLKTLDSYRFDIDDNDLRDAVDLYTLYKNNKSHSMVQNAVNDNPRAKLLKIEKFGKDDNWDINLHWTDEEKEALGIKKKDNIMNLDEFNGYISELIDEIHDYQGAIEWLKEDL